MAKSADEGSFIHAARREQLVECAIEVIAEHGLAHAPTVRIAERAGVSRGVLTYHFRDRAELIELVVARVYDLGAEQIGPKMARATSPREALLTFISGSVELYAAHPKHLAALTDIFAASRTGDSPSRSGHRRHQREMSDLGQILRARQEQFRAFNIDVMCKPCRATSSQRARMPRVRAVPSASLSNPSFRSAGWVLTR